MWWKADFIRQPVKTSSVAGQRRSSKVLPKAKWKLLSCVQPCDPMDCSLPGFPVHRILQIRILEWVAISFSRGSSQPKDRIQVSHIAGGVFTIWATSPIDWLFNYIQIFKQLGKQDNEKRWYVSESMIGCLVQRSVSFPSPLWALVSNFKAIALYNPKLFLRK